MLCEYLLSKKNLLALSLVLALLKIFLCSIHMIKHFSLSSSMGEESSSSIVGFCLT